MAFMYFPRGYRIELSRNHSSKMDVNVEGDVDVMKLWDDYCSPGFNCNDPDNMTRILAAAKRLIPDPIAFILNQASNPHVYGANRSYLYELYNFVTEGKRSISNEAFVRILNEDVPRPPSGVLTSQDMKLSVDIRESVRKLLHSGSVTTSGRYPWLNQWLLQKNSPETILCTLYILFGQKS